jgi:Legume lectin domain/PEP-CTERM motif
MEILMRAKTARFALAAALSVAAVQAGAAVVIQYNNFLSTAGLTVNGNAAAVGGALRVTPADFFQSGSFFSTNTVSLAANASFSTYFRFRFTGAGGSCDGATTCGADGLVFVVQTQSNNVGGAGGGIGYLGIANSLGIEFDTWNNGAIDNNSSNHVGIDLNGSVASAVLAEVTEADMNAGDIWNAWVDYNGATNLLEVRMGRSAIRPVASILSLTRNIALDLGSTNAFVGFTSGTGSAFANHDLLSWTLDNSFAPIGTVPEPGSAALAGGALAALMALRRRRVKR